MIKLKQWASHLFWRVDGGSLHTHLEEEAGQEVPVEGDLFALSPMWENRTRCRSEDPQFAPSLRGRQGAPTDLEALEVRTGNAVR